ncbi:unnamed protein product, partial [Rotaria sordida]
MENQQLRSMNFFVLADSHAKFIPPTFTTSSYSLVTRSIPVTKTVLSTPPTTIIDPNLSLPSTSSLTLDQAKSNKKSKSRAVLDRKNKKRFQQLKLKRQQHTTKRKIHHQWTAPLIKQYLDSLQIKYSRIPPVHNRILRIVFNNQHDQDLAAEHLGIDIFDENHYQD